MWFCHHTVLTMTVDLGTRLVAMSGAQAVEEPYVSGIKAVCARCGRTWP